LRKFFTKIDESPEGDGGFFFSAYANMPEINKQGAINLMLDTGASATIFGENDLRKLGLELKEIKALPIASTPIAGWVGQLKLISLIMRVSYLRMKITEVKNSICLKSSLI